MTGLRASGPRRLVAARRVASLPGDGLKRHGCFTAGRRVVFSVRVAVNVTMAVRTGLQEWPDGSRFEGQFVDGMKQGAGLYVWPSGESYEGSFYKDYRHGNGIYSWPDGSRFTGKFYLNRKESYGVQLLRSRLFPVNCHSDVIHLLLDRGADVNKPNSEGMTPLAICSVLHYPFQSLCVTVAEKKTQKVIFKYMIYSCEVRSSTSFSCSCSYIRRLCWLADRRCTRWAIITLLLKRGADPNACLVPMPVLFLAIKAGHVEAVRRLLDCGARADLPLPPEQNGLYPLHVAAGLCGDAAPKITELLLHALANPDAQAGDNTDSFSQLNMLPQPAPPEGGRTALHIACQRQDDHNVRDVVSLLLSHKARTDLLWSGHSPLSLAIANGNELAVDVLLRGGADPNLVLSHRVGSALCANANITYEATCHPSKRAGMLQKLISAGANILVPVLVSEGRRCIVGTAVDYAHFAFQQDKRIAHTPYHALNPSERETFIARRHLLSLMGGFMRQAALTMERHQLEQEREQEQGLGACPGQKFVKPLFKYCYQCGRSALVVLVPCTRCRHVFYCSSNCKMKAWDECHKDECVRVPGVQEFRT
uniref:MYND-type domain-containing protein n=1 Tax=Denticeps clupeoides TaxID=299321 RepID=A0AAY4C1L8_9TELE